MARSDDLSPLFVPRTETSVGLRFGVVESWDTVTASSTVTVDGALMTDLPVLESVNVAAVVPGDVVAILTYGASWGIIGRFITP